MAAATNAFIARECTIGPKGAGSEDTKENCVESALPNVPVDCGKMVTVERWHNRISAPVFQRVPVRSIQYTAQ